MRNLEHDFGQFNDVIKVYLDILLENSNAFYDQQIIDNIIDHKDSEKKVMQECIKDVEDFLYYYYQSSPDNYANILNLIINNVKTVACLPKNKRGIYGEAQADKKIIYINPNLSASQSLSSLERTKLYVAHELGHIINNEWMKSCEKSLSDYCQQGIIDNESAQLMYEGFSMLNESITQNRAEDFVYSNAKKRRPDRKYYRNMALFNGESYLTNYDYYGELQSPTILFARTLRGIGQNDDDNEVLQIISKRALSPDFYDNILKEYISDNQLLNFIKLAMLMGCLKKASYAKFGHDDSSFSKNSANYLREFQNLALKLWDKRDEYSDISKLSR